MSERCSSLMLHNHNTAANICFTLSFSLTVSAASAAVDDEEEKENQAPSKRSKRSAKEEDDEECTPEVSQHAAMHSNTHTYMLINTYTLH